MHIFSFKPSFPVEKPSRIILHLLLFLSLLLVLCGVSIEFSGSFETTNSLLQQYAERTEENTQHASTSVHEIAYPLLMHQPRSPGLTSLMLPNYPEDHAVREALLAGAMQWQVDAQTGQAYYRASNTLSVYMDSSPTRTSLLEGQVKAAAQPDGTLLTARILLGLWASRRANPQLSLNGSVILHPDEILFWRGVQKHHRLAYPGSRKQFSDGYPWKQRQQVQQDLEQLSHYRVRGQHVIVSQGKLQPISIDTSYLALTPIKQQEKVVGYLIAPGDWMTSYETHQMNFLAEANCQLFQLNPRNDYLALRLGFYLVEHWRRYARSGNARESFCMAHLLSASMIPIEKANLTSRFAPRVEAALQKLYSIGILGKPPLKLTAIGTSRAYWGKDWLASVWRLVPSRE